MPQSPLTYPFHFPPTPLSYKHSTNKDHLMDLIYLQINFRINADIICSCCRCVYVGLPIFTSLPQSLITPKQRSTLQATCQADGFPKPVINWTRLVMPLPAGKTVVNGGVLTINNLSPADSGFYECSATNSMGTKKATMNVVVQQQPLKGLYSVCYYR